MIEHGRNRLKGLGAAVVLGMVLAAGTGCGNDRSVVVIYTALDEPFSGPILDRAEEELGLTIRARFDTESTKTVGLTQRLIAEANRPRADLFWNNEILNTLRLKKAGLLEPFVVDSASEIPETFRDPESTWYGFAGRARILLVNTELVGPSDRPTSVDDLADARWRGQVGLAKPLFGTTATHAACLYQVWGQERASAYFQSLKANGIQVLSGNRQVAEAVGAGQLAWGLTDTDDALLEIGAGSPVAIVYPDREPDQLGTLFIPNTLALIRDAPNRDLALQLAERILSAQTEIRLAKAASGQIPLKPSVRVPLQVETPATVHAMEVDFERAAEVWDQVASEMADLFAVN